MTDLEQARSRWVKERPAFAGFAAFLESELRALLREGGINGSVSSRAKEVDSLVRKLIRKPEYTYESLPDKVGARVIVLYQKQVAEVLALVQRHFQCGPAERTAGRLGEDKVGYLSTHVDVCLASAHPEAKQYPAEGFHAELQIRTVAENLWSEMSHATIYKAERTVSPELKRRTYLMAGLIEVADNEFSWLEEQFARLPAGAEDEVLRVLERQYSKLSSRRGDPELSLEVIRTLLPLYGAGVEWERHFQDLFERKGSVLKSVLEEAEGLPESRSAFLFQPEVLMIYDLLEAKMWDVVKTWGESFPPGELERLANRFGMSVE